MNWVYLDRWLAWLALKMHDMFLPYLHPSDPSKYRCTGGPALIQNKSRQRPSITNPQRRRHVHALPTTKASEKHLLTLAELAQSKKLGDNGFNGGYRRQNPFHSKGNVSTDLLSIESERNGPVSTPGKRFPAHPPPECIAFLSLCRTYIMTVVLLHLSGDARLNSHIMAIGAWSRALGLLDSASPKSQPARRHVVSPSHLCFRKYLWQSISC